MNLNLKTTLVLFGLVSALVATVALMSLAPPWVLGCVVVGSMLAAFWFLIREALR